MTPEPPLRILAISPYAPCPPYGGGKMRVFHLLDEWLRLGHRVTLWMAPCDEPEASWCGEAEPELRALPTRDRRTLGAKIGAVLSRLPEEAWGRPPDVVAWPAEDLSRFDVAVLFQAHVGRFAAPLRAAGIPVVLDAHNVEAQIAHDSAVLRKTKLGRLRSRLDQRRWRTFERELIDRAALTVAVSDRDAAAFRTLVPAAPISVHPSGADLRSLGYVDHSANHGDRLVMTGTLGYLPNLDAALWMLDSILPLVRTTRPDTSLLLVGSAATEDLRRRTGDRVEVLERVPDIRPYLESADLFVAPLRHGGGTRLKLLEAFAAGLPAVATSIASAGIDVRHGIEIATADDADSFAAEIVRLLEDGPARRAMAESARRLVEERYDWRKIAADYAGDLREATRMRSATGPRHDSHPY